METKNGWQNYLAEVPDLKMVKAALVREQVIRDTMARTGEDRQIAADFFDAHVSMDQEAVLDLMDGEPTTLADGLRAYIETLAALDNYEPIMAVAVTDALHALLVYPWPGEVDTLQP